MDEVIVLSGEFLSLYRIRGEIKYSTFDKLHKHKYFIKKLSMVSRYKSFHYKLSILLSNGFIVVAEEGLKC